MLPGLASNMDPHSCTAKGTLAVLYGKNVAYDVYSVCIHCCLNARKHTVSESGSSSEMSREIRHPHRRAQACQPDVHWTMPCKTADQPNLSVSKEVQSINCFRE